MATTVCTTENSKPYRSYHKSIIKEVVPLDSTDSGISTKKNQINIKKCLVLEDCISLDGHHSSILSAHNHVSTQTSTTFPPHAIVVTHTFRNTDNISSEDICQETTVFTSQSHQTPHRYRCFKPKQIRSPSPSPYRKINDQQSGSIASRRAHSVECLSLPKLGETLTDDSGAGDLEAVPTPKSALCNGYDMVPVFGLPPKSVALMTNRYNFDPSKVEEYRRKKRRNFLKSPFKSVQPVRRNTINDSATIKSEKIFSRIVRAIRSPSTNQISTEPIIRHHSSQDRTDEDE
jgi:hypothetical protein